MNIRQIEEKELDRLIKLIHDLFIKWEKVDDYDKLDVDYLYSNEQIEELKKYIKKNFFLIAIENDEILGFVDAEVKNRAKFYEIKKEGHINLLFVKENQRKKGIGNLLIEKIFGEFKKQNIKFITVNTHALDGNANEFWKKRDFREYNITYVRRK